MCLPFKAALWWVDLLVPHCDAPWHPLFCNVGGQLLPNLYVELGPKKKLSLIICFLLHVEFLNLFIHSNLPPRLGSVMMVRVRSWLPEPH